MTPTLLWFASTGILGTAYLASTRSGRREAHRHVACGAGVLGVLLLPFLLLVLPAIELPWLPAASGTAASAPAAAPSWLAAIWAIGSLLLLARVALGIAQLHAIRQRARVVEDPRRLDAMHTLARRLGLRRMPKLLEDARGATAMTWGTIRPVIVLPPSRDWTRGRLQAVLVHELAHIRRRDALLALGAQLACALFWPNPLVWRVSRRLRAAQEFAADELALRVGAEACAYATHLFEVAAGRRLARDPSAALAIGGAPAHLGDRLHAVLHPSSSLRRPLQRPWRMWVAGLALAAPWAGIRITSRPAPAQPERTLTRMEPHPPSVTLPSGTLPVAEPLERPQPARTQERKLATPIERATSPRRKSPRRRPHRVRKFSASIRVSAGGTTTGSWSRSSWSFRSSSSIRESHARR